MFTENFFMKASVSSVERQLRKKKRKFISKILILTLVCVDGLFLTGFIGFRLYNKWVEANQSIYPVAVEDEERISPTSIPWIKTKAECLKTKRVWKDDECLDSEWSHLF